MAQRNTPEAEKLLHCDTCGATSLDGNGKVTLVHGIAQCGSCRRGAQQLVREEPQDWEYGPDGRLRRKTPWPGRAEQVTAVQQLHTEISAHVAGLPGVRVEVFHELSGVAVTMPNGYRWHVYVPGSGPYAALTPSSHAVLFTPDRNIVPGFPAAELDELPAIREVVEITTDPDSPLGRRVDADSLARLEITLFDADTLLPEQP